jgi:hypothetical protein
MRALLIAYIHLKLLNFTIGRQVRPVGEAPHSCARSLKEKGCTGRRLNLRSRHHTSFEVGLQLRIDYGMALTGSFFELLAIQNVHFPATVVDDSCSLQDASRHGHAGSTRAQHVRKQSCVSGRISV